MRLAIVGCGGIAAATARAANMNERVELAASCDINAAVAQAFADSFGIPRAFEDYTALLEAVPLDAVYLSVPHALHAPMALQAIERGIQVWCEKPIAISTAEANEMAARAKSKGVKLGVNYQYRYDADCARMVQSARDGALGQVFYARCHVPFHRTPIYYDGWHASLQMAGGGTMLTVGSHMLDAAMWACASRPVSAVGKIKQMRFKDVEVEDLAMGIVELESGALIEICSSMVATPEKRASIELYGSEGTAYFPPLEGSSEESNFEVTLARSLEGFRAWVEEGQPYRIPAEEAIPALRAVELIYQSARGT